MAVSNSLFSKNKEDLNSKINYLIKEESIDIEYKNALERWLVWFKKNYDLITLPDITEKSKFYRAFYSDPDLFGIQIWETSEADDTLKIWSSNVVFSDYHELNDDKTIII